MTLRHPAAAVFAGLPPDEPDGGDRERYIDALVARTRELLGEAGYARVFNAGLDSILSDIRDDLAEFGVTYDRWYSERSLAMSGALEGTLQTLRESPHTEMRDGALWFRATAFGDEKDRVVVRENGAPTYFASDIAYHLDKYRRGFDRLIDIWGADHHGYVPRVKAALTALGEEADRLSVLLIQFAILYRGKEKVSMSTRAGEFVTQVSCAPRSATTRRGSSTCCVRMSSTWTSIWNSPSRRAPTTRSTTCNMPTPACAAYSASLRSAARPSMPPPPISRN